MDKKYIEIENFKHGDIFYLFTVFEISGIRLKNKHTKGKIFIKFMDKEGGEHFLQMINSNNNTMKKKLPSLEEFFYTIKKDDLNKLKSDESHLNCAATIRLLNTEHISRVNLIGKLKDTDLTEIMRLYYLAIEKSATFDNVDIRFEKPKGR